MLLHETSVAWARLRLTLTTPKQPWLETRALLGDRLRQICRDFNADYDVERLCREFPGRIQNLIDLGGDNLRK